MRLFKLITSALVAGIVLLFIRQNLSGFRTRIPFSLDLFIREPVGWEHSVYGLMLISGFAGFVLGALVLLRPYVHARRLLAERRTEKAEPETPPSAQVARASEESQPPPPQG